MDTLTSTRKFSLLVFVGGWFIIDGFFVSLKPNFYPDEAERKGAKPSQYGPVFGIENLTALLVAPLCGKFGVKIGLKHLYTIGSLGIGASAIGYAILCYAKEVSIFLTFSYLISILNGMADALAYSSVTSILMKVFPQHATMIASYTEMFHGLGHLIGPAMGALLFKLGDYYLPFVAIGVVLLISTAILWLIVPNAKTDPKAIDLNEPPASKKLHFSIVFVNPTILLPLIDEFFCFVGDGMLEGMLDHHIHKIPGATQEDITSSFLIFGGLYMVGSILTGFICERIQYPIIMSIIGNFAMSLGFLLIGPCPLIVGLNPSISLINGSVGMISYGCASVAVSSFGRSQEAAIRCGFNNDLDTYILISSLWTSSFFLGNFIGPTVSGFLIDAIGYPWTSTILFIMYFIYNFVNLFEFLYLFHQNRSGVVISENIKS